MTTEGLNLYSRARNRNACCARYLNCYLDVVTMKSTAPHYLLFTQANLHPSGGHWKFVLERIGSDSRVVESDVEPNVKGERLQLLAVIRGLEALDQASRVTLVTPSTYVGRGIRSGLKVWSRQNWQVEIDGELKSLRHASLWKRIHAAMNIHQVSCRTWQFDAPHTSVQTAQGTNLSTPFASSVPKQTREYRPNRIRISDEVRRNSFQSAKPMMDAATVMLTERIKPIGEGRSYGYAVT